MRFIVDECTGPAVSRWLKERHDVVSMYEEARGFDDDAVLHKAVASDCILITSDKDFGKMIFHEKKVHKGIILLRLDDERAENKIKVLKQLLEQYADQPVNNFVVVTETTVRITHFQSS